MPLKQIVYASRPFGYDDAVLRQILGTARTINAETGITGSLICREDMYLQLLEGPEQEVEATYERIANDDRHIDVTRLVTLPIQMRMFTSWAMRHDPAQSWMWSREEVADGAIMRASAEDILSVFVRLANQPEASKRCPYH